MKHLEEHTAHNKGSINLVGIIITIIVDDDIVDIDIVIIVMIILVSCRTCSTFNIIIFADQAS